MSKTPIKTQFLVIVLVLMTIPLLSAQTNTWKIKVVTELANIREKPAIDSPIIKQVFEDEILESLGKQGEWFRVVFEKESGEATMGYVHESTVQVIDSPVEQVEEITVRTITEQKPVQKPSAPPSKETTKKPQIIKPAPPPKTPSKFIFPSMGIILSGGGNFTLGGELNDGAKGLAGFYEEQTGVVGQFKVHPVHFSYLISGDLFFPLEEKAFLGIGIDYLNGEIESTVKYDRLSAVDYYSTRPKIQALPIRAYLAYYYHRNTYAKVGIEYYFANAEYYYRFESQDTWKEWVGTAKAQGVGFLLGVGIESKLTRFASLFLEARGRYAKLKDFTGTNTYREFDGNSVTTYQEEGTLYYYEYQAQTIEAKIHPLLYIRERKPAEAGVIDARIATVDFTGASVRLGIKIKF
jgi:hypothetical protein